MALEKRTFVCADALNNNNKFWEYSYDPDSQLVTVKYGRVGKTEVVDPPKKMTRSELERKVKEKLSARGKEGTPTYKPPYREISTLAPTGPSGSASVASKEVLKTAAVTQLGAADPTLNALVHRLVEANKHELHVASGGQLNLDLSTGIVSTPVGVVTKANVDEARKLLQQALVPCVKTQDFDSKAFTSSLNDYLMLVPQQVGHARGWHKHFIPDDSAIAKQVSLLDQLEASADLADARLKAALTSKQPDGTAPPSIFNAALKICTDAAAIKEIEAFYNQHKLSHHESSHLKPIRVYEVVIKHMADAFEQDGAKVGNVKRLWHGTRVFNVLSILKSGLMLPRSIATMQIAGAMFGHGIYFSDQSSKSLNYSYGYWDRGARDSNCFMFLVDVAMGKEYVPRASYETLPKPGYDSTYAVGGKSGVLNNEMIIYNTNQCNPRYLVEFDKR